MTVTTAEETVTLPVAVSDPPGDEQPNGVVFAAAKIVAAQMVQMLVAQYGKEILPGKKSKATTTKVPKVATEKAPRLPFAKMTCPVHGCNYGPDGVALSGTVPGIKRHVVKMHGTEVAAGINWPPIH